MSVHSIFELGASGLQFDSVCFELKCFKSLEFSVKI